MVSIINETQALSDLRVCSFDRVPQPRQPTAQCSTSMRCRARVGFQWPIREREEAQAFAEARRQHPVESAINNLEIAVSTGCARTAPMGLHKLHCRYSAPHRSACRRRCVRPNDVEDAARSAAISCALRPPPGPGTETGTAFSARKSRFGQAPFSGVGAAGSCETSPIVWRFVADFCRSGGFLPTLATREIGSPEPEAVRTRRELGGSATESALVAGVRVS